MASKYRYGVYQCGLREWRRDSHYDYFATTTPARGMVAIFATREEAEADASARDPKADPLPGAPGLPTYAVCDLDDEATYVTGQDVSRSGGGVVYRGKAAIIAKLAAVKVL